jgi:DNA adenine methylase
LAEYWKPTYQRYVEPFAGSACLFFALDPPTALLGDINHDLIDAYLAIREDPVAVFDCVHSIPLGKRSYYRQRAKDPRSLTLQDRAARFIFLNRFCFNGLYRTNLAGAFNVPYSPARTGSLPTLADLELIAYRLSLAEIRTSDFSETIDSTAAGDFIYADPPYAVSTSRIFREYDPHSFAVDDIPRLADCLQRADARGAKIVVTYADSSEFRQSFSHWHMSRVRTPRNISGFAKHRRSAIEIIATNVVKPNAGATV